MRVRIQDTEVAAAFMGLARLRPDVILAPAPATAARARRSGGGANVYDVGLLGSFNSEDRATELESLVRTWTCDLVGRFREAGVEVVS
jgi:hypothetical protein